MRTHESLLWKLLWWRDLGDEDCQTPQLHNQSMSLRDFSVREALQPWELRSSLCWELFFWPRDGFLPPLKTPAFTLQHPSVPLSLCPGIYNAFRARFRTGLQQSLSLGVAQKLSSKFALQQCRWREQPYTATQAVQSTLPVAKLSPHSMVIAGLL